MHVTPSIFFSTMLRREALVYKSYFVRTAILWKLFNIRFSYKHCNFSRVCLLVKMALKTVIRSRPVTRILCGGGGGGSNEAKADQTTEMYFLLSDPFI